MDFEAEFDGQFEALLNQHSHIPNLRFSLSDIVPEHIRSDSAGQVHRMLTAYVVADRLMPRFLEHPDKWKSYDIQRRKHKVIEVFVADFRIRLHWISPEQELGWHRHRVHDVFGIKKNGYNMDVGFSPSEAEPAPVIHNLCIRPSDIYMLHAGTWHEVRHQEPQPSVSLCIKALTRNRVPQCDPLSKKELDSKFDEFASFYS